MAQPANAYPLTGSVHTKYSALPAGTAVSTIEAACFEAHPDPQLLLDADCEVVGSNRAARELLAEARGSRALAERLVAGASALLSEARLHVVETIRSQAASPEFELLISASLKLAFRIYPLGPARDFALLIVRRCAPPKVRDGRDRFGFTPAENLVAERLARGLSVPQIAQELGISIETVRCHLKQAFAKVGVHRQAALVAALLGR